jgi:hypothetical protein
VGAEAPTIKSIRDVVSDLAEKVKAKSQPAVSYVGKRVAAGAASIAVGGAAAAEGAKLLGVLSVGKK